MTKASNLESFNPGQKDVLDLVLLGLSNSDIAEKLEVSYSCVTDRKRKLFEMFNAKNTNELMIKYHNYLLINKEIKE